MSKWNQLFSEFNRLHAVVVGDVMIDSYAFGKVDRISPEAPVPVVAVDRKEKRLGGAANVALNLRALGVQVSIASVVGDDEEGQNLQGLLQKEGIGTQALVYSEERKTTIKHRIIGNNVQMLRVDEESLHTLSAPERLRLLQGLSRLLEGKVDVLIFEDYDKGVLDETLIEEIIRMAGKKGIPTVVDPKKQNFLAYKGATLFKPNLKEIREGLKLEGNLREEETLKAAVYLLREKLNNPYILVTLSEQGVVISHEGEWIHLPAHLRNIADVSGAGDTVVSVAAVCLALGVDALDIAFLSNLAGGLVCEKVGVVPIEKDVLLKEALRINA